MTKKLCYAELQIFSYQVDVTFNLSNPSCLLAGLGIMCKVFVTLKKIGMSFIVVSLNPNLTYPIKALFGSRNGRLGMGMNHHGPNKLTSKSISIAGCKCSHRRDLFQIHTPLALLTLHL